MKKFLLAAISILSLMFASCSNANDDLDFHVIANAASIYTVSFDSNGGSGSMKKQDFRIGAPEEINDCTFTAPTSGYKFSCWNTKADGSGESYNNHEKFCIDSADVVLYAIWIPKTSYGIIYKNVYDATNENVTSYTVADTVTLLPLEERNGMSFEGWYTTSTFNSGSKVTGWDRNTKTGNIELYARWIIANYTITYSNLFNAANSNVTSYTVNDVVSLSAPGARTGLTFDGWYTTSDFKDGTKITGWTKNTRTGDVELFARWTLTTITLNKNVVIFNGPDDEPVQINVENVVTNEDVSWECADPEIATVNNGLITPVKQGLTTVKVKYDRTMTSIAVIVMRYDANVTYDAGSVDATYNGRTYKTDSANQVAFRIGGSMDFAGRLKATDPWCKTTYSNGGWTWRINSNSVTLDANGNATSNGLALSVRPVLAYDKITGISYVVIFQILTNNSNGRLTGQKFGSAADIMLKNNDCADIEPTVYGASMYDTNSKLQFDVYAKGGEDCTPVDTLWFGSLGGMITNIYGTSSTEAVHNTDTGMSYSWQHIDLEPGETVIKSIRMTLVECKK